LSSSDVTWDLSRLYGGTTDPAVERDRAEIERRVARLERHRGTIAALDARMLAAVLEEQEAASALLSRLTGFTHLAACTDEQDEAKVHLRERFDELSGKWSARLVFLALEMQKIPDDRFSALLAEPALAPWRHYLRHLKVLSPHTLSEKEEQVVLKKNIAGKDAL